MMGKYILAHWCYSGNFGDALNPYLLEKLSGMKVKYCIYNHRTTKTNQKYPSVNL